MRIYAQSPALRGRQSAADLALAAWTLGWVLVARTVHGAVLALAGPGRAVENLGSAVGRDMGSAARAAGDVPLVGDQLSKPFDAVAGAGASVRGAGQGAEHAVGTLAAILAIVLVVLPVGWLLLRWLSWRLRWARDAAAAGRLLAGTPDLDVLAARALATAPLPLLAGLPAGTGAAWHTGDPAAVRALAAVELGRLGLRLPAPEDGGATVTTPASSSPTR